MRQYGKQYGLTLLTLLLVVLGAAMPWLTSAAQDAQIHKLQEELDLNTVSLTLLQNNGAEQTLRIVSSEYVAVPWTGETKLTGEQAEQAALEAIQEMSGFGLTPEEDVNILKKTGWYVYPELILTEDGRSALVWECSWDTGGKTSRYAIVVDDASGRAVRMITANADWVDGTVPENAYALMERWVMFLQSYYDVEMMQVREAEDGGDEFDFTFYIFSPGSGEVFALCLSMFYDTAVFNFWSADTDAGLMSKR